MLRSRARASNSPSVPASSMAKGHSLGGKPRRPHPTFSSSSPSSSIGSTTSALPLPLSRNALPPPTTSTSTSRRRTASTAIAAAAAAAAAAASSETGESAPFPPPPPRRRVVILPGLGNCDADYAELASLLRSKGAAVRVARVARIDWARNAAGLLLPEYWKGTLKPRPTVDWYLERIDEALEALNEEISSSSKFASSNSGDDGDDALSPSPFPPLTLLAHSAGGWLGRVWMLSEQEGSPGKERAALVSDFVCVPPPPLESSKENSKKN